MSSGMIAAAAHAKAVIPSWTDDALSFLLNCLESNSTPMLAEEVVEAAVASGCIAAPPDKRAWGAVFNTAARRGLIAGAGFARAITSNNSFKTLWRRT